MVLSPSSIPSKTSEGWTRPNLSDSIVRRLEIRSRIGNDPYLQALEIARCSQDVVFWINRWVWTYDPREKVSTLPFELFPRQEEFLHWIEEREASEEDGVAEKCRDVGFTWLTCAFMEHRWLFKDGFKGGFGSRKLDLVDKIGDPDCIFEKLRFILRNVPTWMLPHGFAWSQHDNYCKLINPSNGSAITGEGGDEIGRGGRASVYVVDEAAFLEHPQKVEASLSQTARCKLWVSTPNGMGNTFYKKRFSGNVSVFTFRWQDDPRKGPEWYAKQKRDLDPIVLAQEVDIDYAASIEGICIPAKYVQAAIDLPLRQSGHKIGGWDIADEGKNKNVLLGRCGPVVTDVLPWTHMDIMQSAYHALKEAEKIELFEMFYDAIGIGAGVKGIYNGMEVKPAVKTRAVNVGEPATETRWPDGKTSRERFLNLRAELWWTLRRRFEKAFEYRLFQAGAEGGFNHPEEEMISIPSSASELIAQLSMPLYHHTETGKLQLESKKDMQKRGVASPDFADALALAYHPQKAVRGWSIS